VVSFPQAFVNSFGYSRNRMELFWSLEDSQYIPDLILAAKYVYIATLPTDSTTSLYTTKKGEESTSSVNPAEDPQNLASTVQLIQSSAKQYSPRQT
jgi:hypothetical protein